MTASAAIISLISLVNRAQLAHQCLPTGPLIQKAAHALKAILFYGFCGGKKLFAAVSTKSTDWGELACATMKRTLGVQKCRMTGSGEMQNL